MGLADFKALSNKFDSVAYSPPIFPIFRKGHSLARQFAAATGIISRFAIEPAILFPQLKSVLAKGRMHPMNAAAFMCVNSNRHDSSKYDTADFLTNFLNLYSATTWQECCEIEGIEEGTDDYTHIQIIGNGTGNQTDKLERIKIFCWARDLERATQHGPIRRVVFGNTLFKKFGSKQIARPDVYEVLTAYNKHAAQALDLRDQQLKAADPDAPTDMTALPKETYLELLRKAMSKNDISHTQCAIMLMFILHAREKRNSGGSYIKHPVAVAKLVDEFGEKYLGDDKGHVWMACMAALLHDGGEKTDINMDKDLVGLLPDEVIEAIKCLHKKDGETYFQYLERIANNKLASVVKLCDIYHNSSDMGNDPSAKQAFIYPLSANYVEYRLNNPHSTLSVADYCAMEKICNLEEFAEIQGIAESNGKKKKASDFPHLQNVMSKVKSVKQILSRDNPDDADPRREKDPTLHL